MMPEIDARVLTELGQFREGEQVEAGIAQGSGADEFEGLPAVRLDLHRETARSRKGDNLAGRLLPTEEERQRTAWTSYQVP